MLAARHRLKTIETGDERPLSAVGRERPCNYFAFCTSLTLLAKIISWRRFESVSAFYSYAWDNLVHIHNAQSILISLYSIGYRATVVRSIMSSLSSRNCSLYNTLSWSNCDSRSIAYTRAFYRSVLFTRATIGPCLQRTLSRQIEECTRRRQLGLQARYCRIVRVRIRCLPAQHAFNATTSLNAWCTGELTDWKTDRLTVSSRMLWISSSINCTVKLYRYRPYCWIK